MTRDQVKIVNLPLFFVAMYLVVSIALFIISPMWPDADNRALTVFYGLAAVGSLVGGYFAYARRIAPVDAVIAGGTIRLNLLVIGICVIDILYYGPQIRLALAYYGYGIWDVFTDIGGNYLQKDALIEEIGQESLGTFYTIINLLSFAQVASFVVPVFKWRDLGLPARLAYVAAVLTTAYFFISIGTMSGVFYVFILSLCGFLAARYQGVLTDPVRVRRAVQGLRRIMLYGAGLAVAFFSFMVYNLSSRATRLTLDLPLLYDDNSIIYRVLGHRLGDGLGLALAYISHGWYGLGKSFEVDFFWTRGLSSSRVVTSYYYRFAGILNDPIPLSYPVRQENLTGFPPFVYWSTVFPWLASDFTWAGALVLTAVFGAFFAKCWLGAIREGCFVSVSMFGLLSIAALFMNANPQVLDNKQLTLALFGLCLLYPFRRAINRALLV